MLRLDHALLLGVTLAACGGTSAVAPPAPPAVATSPPTPATSAQPRAPVAPKRTRGSVAAFARLDAAVPSTYPERARLIRTGRLAIEWPSSENEDEPSRTVDWEPPIIEHASGSRPTRVLCRDPDVQIAAYPDPAWFSTIAREPVVLHPSASRPNAPSGTPVADKEPGVRVSKGARLTVLGSAANIEHLRFESLGLTGEGYAQRVQLGLTYAPDSSGSSPTGGGGGGGGAGSDRFDAELAREGATLLPEPKKTARPLATLTPYPENQASHRFQRLGPRKDGFALVRLLHPETSVVGWIEESALKAGGGQVAWEKEQRPGLGRLRGSRMTAVKRGQLLVSESGAPVGVVLADHETPCVNRCDTESPRVAVRACGGVARAILER